MRIIAGQFRAMPLAAPPGQATRPITDRAKQSLFDALQDCFAASDTSPAGTVLDCFAGPGSMGLECLSRGAARAVFIERDRKALAALEQNIATLKLLDRATVLPIDAYLLPASLRTQNSQLETPYTIAFVDPPYAHTDSGHHRAQLDDLLRALAAHAMVDGGIISFRHPAQVSIDAAALGVNLVRELRYGEMAISWLARR
jgi:16S rRNA (guanine966-N2)-methyltransferase